MCGIVGSAGRIGVGTDEVRRMVSCLRHRGPDDEGIWSNSDGSVVLGHTRLAIVDLSPLGRQPMVSSTERFTISFNGEIYNFLYLKQELEVLGVRFRGSSDTEVMLAAFEAWGIPESLRRFNGMFSFAVFDQAESTLTLARDRAGEKPLFYGWAGGGFWFSSELKVLKEAKFERPPINRDAVALFFRYGYVPTPFCIYEGFHKLLPGSSLTLTGEDFERTPPNFSSIPDTSKLAPIRYWDPSRIVEPSIARDESELDVEFEKLLEDSIARRMVADVPLGAFLSGGVDSSTIVALMQKNSARPVRTFCIGFSEGMVNEAPYAKAVAEHLGTDHVELIMSSREARDVIPLLPVLFDEPFGDSSQIPTYLVSKLARRDVTVALSGDGGDELFAGYSRFFWAESIWGVLRYVPYPLRSSVGSMLKALPISAWSSMTGVIAPLYAKIDSDRSKFGHRVHRLGEVLKVRSGYELYDRFVSHWVDPIVKGAAPSFSVVDAASRNRSSLARELMYVDLRTYLPDDLMTKVDRVSMGVSLEARVPFLDHRLIEFALALPTSTLIRGGEKKQILRRVLYKYVPRQLIERPKQGFGVPVDQWLKGPLREWAEDLLSIETLREQDILDADQVHLKWGEFLRGERLWEHLLWDVLMFQAWMREYRS